jgi:hypothetical protein
MIWQRLDHKFPPTDPQNSSRSIPVLTLDLSDGLTFKDKRNGNILNRYDFYEPMLISAYYDFNKKTWSNDILGKRSGEINATHWMFIPPVTSSIWIQIDKYLPPPEDNIPKIRQVLICDQRYNHGQSVVSAEWASNSRVWCCFSLTNDHPDNILDAYVVPATHWIPYPPSPTE